MNRLHIMVCSLDGRVVEVISDIPVGIDGEFVSATIVPGEQHGPWDVPCGHAGCRRSLDVAEACAEERDRLSREDREDWEGIAERAYWEWNDGGF